MIFALLRARKTVSNLFLLMVLMTALLISSCKTASHETSEQDEKVFEKALQNAERANEGFIRSEKYMRAWLAEADPESKLVPRRLFGQDQDIWNAQDCAADNYPFLVLTSFFTDKQLFSGLMREMLNNEIRLTSRVKSMPDTWSFSKKDFLHEKVSMDRIVFGTSEYMKDGLLPLTEWLGESPWSDRMVSMLSDLDEYINVANDFTSEGFGNSPTAEVNGELLQVLSRAYWMTGEQKFLDWAIAIGDHFLLGEGYPLKSFELLKMRDHGCELVAGLCELYVTLHYADPEKKKSYKEPLHSLLDYVLAHARNEDGFFYNGVNPQTDEVVAPGLADTWGYTLNGFYSVYMVDSVAAHKAAVVKIFEHLDKYRNYNWENLGADGFADAIEGGLNLYNRIPDERAALWIDSEIKVMWSIQDSSHRENALQWKNSGIIEGWYGDGNFARTTIMYNLWKSKGTWVHPWRKDVRLGAEMKGDHLYIVVSAEEPWDGTIVFDQPRHKTQMNLPVDWPRINQFPEWFTVTSGKDYQLSEAGGETSRTVDGDVLIEGLDLTLKAGEIKRMVVVLKE